MKNKTAEQILAEVRNFLNNNVPDSDAPLAGCDAVDMLVELMEIANQTTSGRKA